MALLTTSITMRNKPSRLLDKGPDYLRTRTNDQMFANRRKSAVELLAASRPQYVKSAALLDSTAGGLTATTPDRHCRSFCQTRERPPVRSKSEFDVSKLHELLALDDVDSNGLPGDTNAGTLSEGLRPLSGGGGKEEEKEGEEEERESHHTATATLTLQVSAAPRDTGSGGERKINSRPDRQDESQRFLHSRADVAAAASTPAQPPQQPPSSPPPPPPSSSSASHPGGAGTQWAAPAIYTARPIYINLSRSASAHTTGPATAPKPPSNIAAGLSSNSNPPPVPDRSIRVLSAASHLLSPPAMSEESSDKTPTNPTGGDLTPGEEEEDPASTPVQVEPSISRGKEARGGGAVTSATVTTAETTTATTSSTSSSPGPRLSLRSSGEFVTVSGIFNPVPRSFSDISCHHSRASSDVSSEASRGSRASAGANLEKFFNEMGMERDILDPMIQLQQRRYGGGSELDIYESVSSLESHDARSICSALSRSEKEISDPESFERNQQQTSVVERNARIIKWLCSVKKAKTPATSVQGSAAS